eukprot:COSAG01_NODE_9658_length_2378_cov_1.586222_3_plen_79_part_00
MKIGVLSVSDLPNRQISPHTKRMHVFLTIIGSECTIFLRCLSSNHCHAAAMQPAVQQPVQAGRQAPQLSIAAASCLAS